MLQIMGTWGKRTLVCGAWLLLLGRVMALDVLSPAFVDGGNLPELYSTKDSECSPPLQWSCDSQNVATYILVVDELNDFGAPIIHWVVYNIPRSWKRLPENYLAAHSENYGQPEMGLNDWAGIEWIGQTQGPAKLRFRLIAISRKLSFSTEPRAHEVLSAAQRHIVEEAEISAWTR